MSPGMHLWIRQMWTVPVKTLVLIHVDITGSRATTWVLPSGVIW